MNSTCPPDVISASSEDVSPLVWAQAAVCRGQERLQVGGELVQLHGEGGEAVVQQVILRLGIWRVTQAKT